MIDRDKLQRPRGPVPGQLLARRAALVGTGARAFRLAHLGEALQRHLGVGAMDARRDAAAADIAREEGER